MAASIYSQLLPCTGVRVRTTRVRTMRVKITRVKITRCGLLLVRSRFVLLPP